MSIKNFTSNELKELWRPREDSSGEDNGQVTIIGGSSLFHGAPVFSLKAASRLVDMVFFASPEESLGVAANEIKAKVNAFIWVPWTEVEAYIEKSDAVLIGPGFMRFESELNKHEELKNGNSAGQKTRDITQKLLAKFPNKKWVIDGGSLQVMEKSWIPEKSILTPNAKEYEMLFNLKFEISNLKSMAKLHKCVIVYKGPVSYVTDGETMYEVQGGNAGLTKGGSGDTLAGVMVGLLAKNDSLLAAASGSYVVKKTAERLFEKVGYGFNGDDLAEAVFETKKLLVGY